MCDVLGIVLLRSWYGVIYHGSDDVELVAEKELRVVAVVLSGKREHMSRVSSWTQDVTILLHLLQLSLNRVVSVSG